MSALQKQYNYELFTRNYPETFIPKPTPRKRNLRLVYRAPQKDEFDVDDIVETDHDETLEGMQVSEEDYWEKYYTDTPYEWNNGILEAKSMGDFGSYLQADWFIRLIQEYFKTCIAGMLVGLEIGFRFDLPEKSAVRRPDLGVILTSNPYQMNIDDSTYEGCFDMCIEFISDSNPMEIIRDTVIKKAEYEQAGIKEYFILDRIHAETVFYRMNAHGQYKEIEPDKNGVIKSNVLSNFQFRYDDLLSLPSSEQLREEPVYSHFFQTDYMHIKQRAKKAEKKLDEVKAKINEEKCRADKERRRADEEKRRADEAIERERKLLDQLAMLKK